MSRYIDVFYTGLYLLSGLFPCQHVTSITMTTSFIRHFGYELKVLGKLGWVFGELYDQAPC
jgi:hypothetical protein